MALTALGTIAVPTHGTKVQISALAIRCQTIFFQALKTSGHSNTGNVYVYGPDSTNQPVRIATLAIPTANTIPSFSVTIPNAPGGLSLNQFYLDSDVDTDGADVTYLGP